MKKIDFFKKKWIFFQLQTDMSTSTYRPIPRQQVVRRRIIDFRNSNAETVIRFNKRRELSLAIEHGYIRLNSLN